MKVGRRIHQARLKKGMTIPELAEATGLSRGFISQVENDKTSVSLDNLEKIAVALDVSLVTFLQQLAMEPEVVRKEATLVFKQGEGPEVMMVSAPLSKQLQVTLVELPAGYKAGGYEHAHPGEECLHVVQGRVLATQGVFETVLEEGDSLHWDGSMPHTCQNAGGDSALLFVAVSPPAMLPVTKINDKSRQR